MRKMICSDLTFTPGTQIPVHEYKELPYDSTGKGSQPSRKMGRIYEQAFVTENVTGQ